MLQNQLIPNEEEVSLPANQKILRVQLPVPLDKQYDYLLPDYADAQEGSYVEVPFGPQRLIGVVWKIHTERDPKIKLKPVNRILDLPPMPRKMMGFVERVAAYTLAPIGMILKMSLSGADLKAKIRPMKLVEFLPDVSKPQKMTKARENVWEELSKYKILPLNDLAEKAGCTPGVITKMGELGLLKIDQVHAWQSRKSMEGIASNAHLEGEQVEASAKLLSQLDKDAYSCTVIDGVTGSGKTEVYFDAIAKCINQGKQVLVLLPEIALSDGWYRRFEKRFGMQPDVWHSDLSRKKRRETWMRIVTGRVPIIVGARSALFLPYQNLGLIIVDEEHETAYKQEEGILYQARDMAILRAYLSEIPVYLASATPSLETVENVAQGKYEVVKLTERHGGATYPDVHIIDLKENKPPSQKWISPLLIEKMREALERGDQVMLFLNRRGYAPLLICRSCGHRFQCPNCTAWLVEHRYRKALQCHHCDFQIPMPKACPHCKAEGELAPCGPGVERIAEEVRQIFPEWTIGLLTSDTMKTPDHLRGMMQAIYDRRVQILVGTQMLAKGHHFPHLTVVGIIDADAGMMGGDLRASERSFQLLHQVSGRAGRENKKGDVYIQSYNAENPILEAMKTDNRDGFYHYEREMRKMGHQPPFTKLAAIIISGEKLEQVQEVSADLARTRPEVQGVQVLGPAPAPYAILRSKHRMRFLIKAPKNYKIQSYLMHWMQKIKCPNAVRIQLDIDPYQFL